MAGSVSKSCNPPKPRRRVEVETTLLKRARDGSGFTRCEACNKDVPAGLIDMHSCSLDSKIRMNLEAQVSEVTEARKPTERKRAAPSENKEKKSRKEKKSKGSGTLKRPPTAFFLFMDDFRKECKALNPDSRSVSAVAKDGGAKWKSMTDEEKKPYIDRAAELKAEYVKAVETENAEENEDGKPLSENEEE